MRLRRKVGAVVRRAVIWAAPRVGLSTYVPQFDYRADLEELTEYVEDASPVRDKRHGTRMAGRDLTVTTDGLEDMLDVDRYRGRKILEVGPKYGIHSLWIDETLDASELVFADFASDRPLHADWTPKLRTPYRFVYGDVREGGVVEPEPFDLVFFLGVLYHSVYPLSLLAVLNRATRLGGEMLLETSYHERPDACLDLVWQPGSRKAKSGPSLDAVRLMLAWTGWRKVRRFIDYRPASTEAVFLCEKTDELVDGSDFAWVVTPHRPAVP
jgi:SAM-dependent methyltransferase